MISNIVQKKNSYPDGVKSKESGTRRSAAHEGEDYQQWWRGGGDDDLLVLTGKGTAGQPITAIVL